MLKNNKGKLIVSSILILLPILAGLLLWDRLPERLTTHWGADGNADGFMDRALAIVIIPVILLAVHWLCVLFTARDPKNREQTPKALSMVLWIIPATSILMNGLMYAVALGMQPDMMNLMMLMLGLMFVLIGNYLPKCKQNFTIGIKVKWALASEENWNATHRFGGRIWVVGGFLMMLGVFLPSPAALAVLLIAIFVLAAAPMIYSWAYYKKQAQAGKVPEKAVIPMTKAGKAVTVVMSIFLVVLLIGIVLIMVTGDVRITYGEERFTVDATYWSDLTVDYSAIDSIEYRQSADAGDRVSGFGSPRLSLGTFQNEEFGNYTRFSYTGCKAAVVLRSGDRVLVLNGPSQEATYEIYQALLERLG